MEKKVKGRMKNVLVISREYPPHSTTGIAIYLKRIIDRVQSYHFDVISFCHPYKTKNTEVIHIERKIMSRYPSAFQFFISSITNAFKKDYDLIIGNGLIGGITGVFIKLLQRKPLVSTVYDVDFLEKSTGIYGFFGRWIRRIPFKLIFYFSDRLVVMSRFSKKAVLTMSNLDENDINVVEAGAMDKEEMDIKGNVKLYKKLKKQKKGYIILFVGVIHSKKGLEYAVEAMSRILKRIHAQYYIVGPEVEEDYAIQIKELVKRKKLEKYIKFIGRVENKDLWPYYKICDLYLASSSRTDCFGMPIVEAAGFSKPAVATELFEENGVIISNETGIVVPIRNLKAIEDAVVKLLKNKKLRKRLGKNAKTLSKRFTWEKAAQKLERSLESID